MQNSDIGPILLKICAFIILFAGLIVSIAYFASGTTVTKHLVSSSDIPYINTVTSYTNWYIGLGVIFGSLLSFSLFLTIASIADRLKYLLQTGKH